MLKNRRERGHDRAQVGIADVVGVCPLADDAPGGEPRYPYYAEWEFRDMDAFKAAARTPEFAETGKDAMAMGVPFHVQFADVA